MTEPFSRTAALSGPPPIPPSHGVIMSWSVGLLMMTALITLFLCEPHGQPFYPQCGLYVATGLACLSCGGLRAAHQLLHGNLSAAFALNPLFMVLISVVGWLLVNQAGRKVFGRPWSPPFQHRAWILLLVTLVVVFFVTRNRPVLKHLTGTKDDRAFPN